MEVADKSVATDEIKYTPPPADEEHNTCLEVARLEAVLNTLVEQKVDAMKTGGGGGGGRKQLLRVVASSPRTLAKRLRIASLSTSVADRECAMLRAHRKRRHHHHHKSHNKGGRRAASRSPMPLPTIPMAPNFDPAATNDSCCCVDHSVVTQDTRIPMSYDDDYVSLKIDECDEPEFEEDDYESRRRRRKRRKRRRKRRRMRAMAAVAIVEEVRHIDPDELPPKARWTIIATAGILLFMCLMLIGVTLRMAPLIDDMVRKENEALMHSLHGNGSATLMPTGTTITAL